MRRASAKRVKWGISDHRGSPARFLADFRHTALNGADLTEAQICGYFYGTQMGGASLLRTDLSHSDLLGPMHHGMSFAGAQLHGAKMCDCRLSSVSFFNADCAGADFSRAILSDVRMKGCVLTRARFREAEIERTMFSPDQMQQVDVRRRNVKSRNCVERPIKALSSCKEKRSNSNWKHCCAIDSLGTLSSPCREANSGVTSFTVCGTMSLRFVERCYGKPNPPKPGTIGGSRNCALTSAPPTPKLG